MTTNGSFDRRLAGWLEMDAEGRVPDHFAEILVRTRATRQRPWWSSPERWLGMDVPVRLQFAPAARLAWLGVVLAALIALAATALLVGSGPTLPSPLGLAANGSLVYGGPDGDIYVLDSVRGEARPLIAGPAIDVSPSFSRDGSKVAFVRMTGGAQLVLADRDGAIIRTIALKGTPTSITWSPDGSRLAVVDSSSNTFSIVMTDGSGVRPVDLGLVTDRVFWRPNGRELVFQGEDSVPTHGFYVVGADGSGLRQIVQPVTDESHVQGPALSPDGSTILYSNWQFGGALFSLNVDTGATERLRFDPSHWSDYWPQWSPDGSQIVFNRGSAQERYFLAVGSPSGGSTVQLGPTKDWDAAADAVFSPDGTAVIARYSDGETWLLNVAGGAGIRLDLPEFGEIVSWQRLAP
jgi:TolB protein